MVSIDPTTLGRFLVAFFTVAALGALLALTAAVDFVARNRRARVARAQSVRTYYRGMALSH